MPEWQIALKESVLGDESLTCHRMQMREELGRPFECDVYLRSDKADLSFTSILGQEVTVTFGPAGDERHLRGHVCAFTQLPDEMRKSAYRATIRPWLWFLSRATNCRIFQEKSAPDIIKQVFSDHGFTKVKDRLEGSYRVREFCVQYRESDLDFVSRLMEEEGIYYYFTHTEADHELVLSDAASSHDDFPGGDVVFYPGIRDEDHISGLRIAHSVQPGAVVFRAYDFTKPKSDLEVKRQDAKSHSNASYEVYEYSDHYRERTDGEQYVGRRMDELASGTERIHMEGNVRGLGVGQKFTLKEHPRDDQNRKYLVVAAHYTVGASSPGVDPFSSQIEVVPAAASFRVPPVTPRARALGPQSAVVVGKSGEEIWTDKYGRVKVQFMWDRVGTSNEQSSCWVRVAQLWSGNQFGGFQVPRIGEEVIIDFLGGDPDHPIIIGRVYNNDNAYPYPLPENQTQSGIKTRSSKGGGADNFNELRFEDKKDSEEIYFHAEKNFNRVVENDDTLKVGFDKHDKGDQTVEIYNDQTITIGVGSGTGSHTFSVKKDRKATVQQGDDTLEVSTGKQEITIKTGDHKLEISAGKSETSAQISIEFKVGGSSIKLDQSGVTITGTKVSIEGTGTAEYKGAMTTVEASGILTVKGSMVKIN